MLVVRFQKNDDKKNPVKQITHVEAYICMYVCIKAKEANYSM